MPGTPPLSDRLSGLRDQQVERFFEDSPSGWRRMILLLYVAVLPPFSALLWLLARPDDQLWATASVLTVCVVGGAIVAWTRVPSDNTWVYPVGVAPVVSCALAFVATDMPAFMAVIGAPLAWAAALTGARTVITALVTGALATFGASLVHHGVLASLGNAGLFTVIQGLVAWVGYGKAWRHREARFQVLARQMPDIELLIRSADGAIVDANRRAVAAYGYSREVLLGLNIRDLRRQDHEAVGPQMQQVSAAEPMIFEATHYRHDGTAFPVEVSSQLFESQGVRYHHSLIRDITDRKESERRLRELLEHLEQRVNEEVARTMAGERALLQQSRQAAMGEMIGYIAHQWRQPLNALGVLVANLRDQYRDQELTAAVMDEHGTLANRLIRQMSKTITDFSNYLQPDKDIVAFSALRQVEEALALAGSSLAHHGVRVEIVGEAEVVTLGFPNEYLQVLLNLLSNARDALTERGVRDPMVRVMVAAVDGRCRVTVADNAGGILSVPAARVFEPYFTTKSHGTGLGLYMSRLLVEQSMGGELTVVNGAAGAEFSILTPIAPADHEPGSHG